ncbi:MAG TPA: alpha/beta fold hydrolase [Burkholderiales bacterium]|jgi:3-oxoadipate enol-lactonase|nr:alpha/beta fold hydrolase [Burkholderiales bacterium]
MKVNVNGININYSVQGEGPWVVMSHSLACDSRMWENEIKALSKRYKVLALDTRGHGGTDAPAGDYTLDTLADDIKGAFDALGVKDPHWIGLSMGGIIAQFAALKYPGIFKSMVLADTTSGYAPNAAALWAERIANVRAKGVGAIVQGTLERWFTEPFRKSHPEVIDKVGGWIAQTPANGFCGCAAALPTINVTARLQELKVPTLVICGEQDMGTPPAMAQAIHQNLPGAELVMIPNAAHLSNMEQPAAFLAAVEKFYSRIGA